MEIEDKKRFVISSQGISNNAETYLWAIPLTGEYEVIFQKIDKNKTLKQLGGLFAVYVRFLSQELGESEDYIHRMLKAKFLARIYISEPKGVEQELWVELLAIYQEKGDQEALIRHSRRISLSWASLKQMKAYMAAIEQHYQAEGVPLPIIQKGI